MCTVLGREEIFIFLSEIDISCTYILLKYTPSPVRTLYGKPLILYIMHFFRYPRNEDILKYAKVTALFIFLALPPETYLQLQY